MKSFEMEYAGAYAKQRNLRPRDLDDDQWDRYVSNNLNLNTRNRLEDETRGIQLETRCPQFLKIRRTV